MSDFLFPVPKPTRRAYSHKRSRSWQPRERMAMGRQIVSQTSMEATRNPATPSWRMCRADMSRTGFIGLMAGWTGALVLILFVSAFIRFVG
jgi:hypothetical protein